jgi:N-acylglucosamine-6-phosphate 2-epimerase/N-acetylmuramic acid 6-phosphate etherase
MSLDRLARGLIVSCQARAGHPLHDTRVISALAQAAVAGGAAGLRINGAEDIRAVREVVRVPIIGIRKVWTHDVPVYITPSFADAAAVTAAGADIVALDATARPRAGGERIETLIPRIRAELGHPVMADVASFEEGERAAALGADLVATTLSGYIGPGPAPEGPDLTLVRRLARALKVPVVAEGRYSRPEQVLEAFRAGAFAVVVGRAITDALSITKSFVDALKDLRP